MSEEQMCPIEMFAELVTYKIDFDNKLQIATFCNELQQTLLENYFDDDYTPTTSSSEDEHDDAINYYMKAILIYFVYLFLVYVLYTIYLN